MIQLHVVLDTNVIISALRSKHGASWQILRHIGSGIFDIHLSIPLVLEYEDVLKRREFADWWTLADADDVLDYVCSVGKHHKIWYLWRPFLHDPKDDLVVELALTAGAQYIVTHNIRHFKQVESLNIKPVTPEVFLRQIGARKHE